MKIKLPRKSPGFTLIEVMLYLALFAVTIGSIVGLSQVAVSHRVKNQVIAEVNFQGEAVLADIINAVRQASSITSPSAGSQAGSLTLAMPGSSVNPTVYEAVSDSGVTRLRLSEGSPAVRNFLTNSHVRLSNLTFINAGVSGSPGSVKIQFDLSYAANNQRQEYQFSKTYYGAANLQ